MDRPWEEIGYHRAHAARGHVQHAALWIADRGPSLCGQLVVLDRYLGFDPDAKDACARCAKRVRNAPRCALCGLPESLHPERREDEDPTLPEDTRERIRCFVAAAPPPTDDQLAIVRAALSKS